MKGACGSCSWMEKVWDGESGDRVGVGVGV